MVTLGFFESGLIVDETILYTKSIFDGITALFLASSLGAKVILFSIPMLIIRSGLILFAVFLEPLLSFAVLTEVIYVGSIILIGLELNMLGIAKLEILNFTPASFLPMLSMLFFS